MQIFVKTLSGQTIVVAADSNDSVQHVKQQIQRKQGTPCNEQRIQYAGKQLEDGLSLRDYNVQKESTLHMLPTLLGGGPKKRCGFVIPSATSSNPPSTVPSGTSTPTTSTPTPIPMTVSSVLSSPPPAPPTHCTSAAIRIAGDCPHCSKSFCSRHRLPEDHVCPGLSDVRNAAWLKNKEQLEKERTVASKIAGA